jgi:hypothetical protein
MPGRPNLNQQRTGGRESVPRRQRADCVLRERNRVLAQHGRLVAVHTEDEIAVAHGHELIEGVEQRQQVVRDDVVRIRLEGAVERAARAGLVPGAHQVHAEIAGRPGIGRIQRERLLGERRRLLETIVTRGLLGRDAIDLAVDGIDRERRRDFLLERRTVVLDVRHPGEHRVRLEVRCICREHLVQLRAGIIATILVQVQCREQQVRIRELRIDLDRALRRLGGGWGIVVLQHARKAGVRRSPRRIALERSLK